MSLYDETIPHFQRLLDNFDKWLDAGVEHAKKKSFDPAVFLQSRLAPDQYPLIRQIGAACDQAKACGARVAGKEPPSHPDTEKTLEEIRARIQKTREFLATLTAKDFEGAESRVVALPFAPGMGMSAPSYVRQLALPNFYFHATLTYEILRHNGVDLGKTHFIGSIDIQKI